MAITRIWQTGWEFGNIYAETDYASHNSSNYIDVSSAQVRTGAYALRMSTNQGFFYKNAPYNLTQCRFAFHINHNGAPSNAATRLFNLSDESVRVVALHYDFPNFSWQIRVGLTTVATGEDVDFATTGVWRHVAVDCKIHPTDGWVYAYRDGQLKVSYHGPTTEGSTVINRVWVYPADTSNDWVAYCYWDNFYWDDTAGEVAPTVPPALYFYAVRPSGNGTYSEWTGSDGNSADNYLLVDDAASDGDDTYVRAGVAGKRDSYAMQDLTIPDGQLVTAVIPLAFAKNEAAGGELKLGLFTRAGSVDQDSPGQLLGTGYAITWQRQANKPGGGAWDQTAINGLEVGVKIEE